VKLDAEDVKDLDALHRQPEMHRSLLELHQLQPGSIFGWTYRQLGWNMKPGGIVV